MRKITFLNLKKAETPLGDRKNGYLRLKDYLEPTILQKSIFLK